MSITSLQGTWQMIRAEFSGEAAPELVVRKTVVTLTAAEYAVRFGGEVVDRGSYVVGGTEAPATIVLHGEAGSNAGRTIPCLVQLKGDRLRVCYGLDGLLPDDMTTRAGQPRYLATYRRCGAVSPKV